MNKINIGFLLFFGGIIFFISLFIFNALMISQDVSVVYGAEPSSTANWKYIIETPVGYPPPFPTSDYGYPPPEPTHDYGYPVPSYPPIPTSSVLPTQMPIIVYYSNYKGEFGGIQPSSNPNIIPMIIPTTEIFNYFLVNETITFHGKPIFNMR